MSVFRRRSIGWFLGIFLAEAVFIVQGYRHGGLEGVDSAGLVLRGLGLVALALLGAVVVAWSDQLSDKAKRAKVEKEAAKSEH
jgi:hypothetical protein